MESERFFKWVFRLLFLIGLFYLFIGIRTGLNVYDEGLSVYGAARILHGEIPYRDFWTIYAPGQFYVLALLFHFFGPSLMVERIFSGLIHFSIVLLMYWLANKLVSRRLALITLFLGFLWVGSFGFFASPTPPAILLSLLSCLCLTDYFFTPEKKRYLWLAGVFAGLVILFRHDLGFYLFLTGTVLVILFASKDLFRDRDRLREKLFRSLKIYSRYLMGTAAVVLPVAIFFIYHAPVQEIISDLIIFPVKTFPQFRSLPYPGPIPDPIPMIRGEQSILDFFLAGFERFSFYFPLVVFCVTALAVIYMFLKEKDLSARGWSKAFFLLLGVTFFNQARVRSDIAHLLPTMILAIILFPSLLSNAPQDHSPLKNHMIFRGFLYGFTPLESPANHGGDGINEISIPHRKGGVKALSFLTGFTLLAIISFSYNSVNSQWQNLSNFLSPGQLRLLDLDRAQGIYIQPSEGEPLEQAIRMIQRCVPRGEKIFVGHSRHDMIFANDVMFYFLSERDSATKYHELHPGLATTRSIQDEIIRELIKQNVNYIVLWNNPEKVMEPNKSSESSGITDLDDFIQSRYQIMANFGPYAILRKHPLIS